MSASLCVLALSAATLKVQAQTFSVLYAFTGQQHGQYPGAVIRDSRGNLYGTTLYGGAHGAGTVFELSRQGTHTVLYSFTGGVDGALPMSVVRDSKGNFYGAAVAGGNLTCLSTSHPPGCGTVFELSSTGRLAVLHVFTSTPDGASPSGVIRDASGTIYGGTQGGGGTAFGTVYELTSKKKETILHNFTGGSDGLNPVANPVRDSVGNLYGTTSGGGTGNVGTVYKVDPTGSESLLHTFTGGAADGAYPNGNLILDSAGNLYGTTTAGGTTGGGHGIVFKLDPSGNETILHTFGATGDGRVPSSGLARDPSGNLYGTTENGGADDWGTVYKLDASGNETVLHSFTGGNDGRYPAGTLVLDEAGNIYGTSQEGGAHGSGVVFVIKP